MKDELFLTWHVQWFKDGETKKSLLKIGNCFKVIILYFYMHYTMYIIYTYFYIYFKIY